MGKKSKGGNGGSDSIEESKTVREDYSGSYQPTEDTLDDDPPSGGSGVPDVKEEE